MRSRYCNRTPFTPLEACLLDLVGEFYLPEEVKILFTRLSGLLVIGAKLKSLSHLTSIQQRMLKRLLVSHTGRPACDVIIRSGYWPTDVDKLAEARPQLKDDFTRFKKKYSKPLSLQQLAANAVRTRLQPNAVVGAKKLVEEGEISWCHAVHLTLGVTKEDMDTWK